MTKRYYKCEETHQTVKGVKLKRCTKCKRWKEISEFCRDHARKDGLKIYCNSCINAYALTRYRKNKKSVRDYLRYEESHRVIRGIKEKLCNRCKQWKYYSDFYKNSQAKDGLSVSCKECESKRTEHKRKSDKKYLRYEDRHRIVKGIKQKLCTKCSKWKAESQFLRDRSSRDGLARWCRECLYKAAGKPLDPKRKSGRRNLRYEERHRVIDGVRQKYCRKCKRWKNENEFYKNRSNRDGLDGRCKECLYKTASKSHKPKGKRTRKYLRYEERHRVVNGVGQKYCRKCKRWKYENEFYKNRSNRDGLDDRCKECSYKPAKKSGEKRSNVKN